VPAVWNGAALVEISHDKRPYCGSMC
jgi:hypothetical protein